jgi:uncharacterized protein (DUF4415 family)
MPKHGDDTMQDEYDFSQGTRGLIRPHPGQTRITLWVDTEVLEAYRAYANRIGEDMTPAMNTALRQYIETLWAQTATSAEAPHGQADHQ